MARIEDMRKLSILSHNGIEGTVVVNGGPRWVVNDGWSTLVNCDGQRRLVNGWVLSGGQCGQRWSTVGWSAVVKLQPLPCDGIVALR